MNNNNVIKKLLESVNADPLTIYMVLFAIILTLNFSQIKFCAMHNAIRNVSFSRCGNI